MSEEYSSKVDSAAVKLLTEAGFELGAATDAVRSGELTQLSGHHYGRFAVQLPPQRSEV